MGQPDADPAMAGNGRRETAADGPRPRGDNGKSMKAPERKKHWEAVYGSRAAEETSWYQRRPDISLDMIRDACPDRDAGLIDVGGGASTLVDHLLSDGYSDLTVLDLSAAALAQAQTRLGEAARRVAWLEADVTRFEPPRRWALWHDRAAFHFLVDRADRQAYLQRLGAALTPGGQVIIATFAPDGPPRCSGLEVVRYDAETLAAELGPPYSLLESRWETHRTPQGREQRFGFHRFRGPG